MVGCPIPLIHSSTVKMKRRHLFPTPSTPSIPPPTAPPLPVQMERRHFRVMALKVVEKETVWRRLKVTRLALRLYQSPRAAVQHHQKLRVDHRIRWMVEHTLQTIAYRIP
jgi:hypothetical protein